MRTTATRVPVPAAAAALLLCALLLCACGGGGGGSSTTEGGAATGGPGPGGPEGQVTFGKAHPGSTAATRAQRRRAGRAAPFVAPGQDNSVPTFGSEASGAERAAAEANLRAYLRARAAREWARACTLLAASVREGYEKLATSKGHTSCARLLPVLAPIKAGVPSDPLRGPLLSLRVQGRNAFALFSGPPRDQQYIVPMIREGGAWRPTQAAPIAYPPGVGG